MCSLEGFATNVCAMKKYWKKVPQKYQVCGIYVYVSTLVCRLCICLKVAVFCVGIVVSIWGKRDSLRVTA